MNSIKLLGIENWPRGNHWPLGKPMAVPRWFLLNLVRCVRAFYAGNFSGMIPVITNVIPATPSNPSSNPTDLAPVNG